MFLFLCTPLLWGCASSGSFPKPFSKEEERRFLLQFKNGTEEEKAAAKEALILHNLRLVAHIAKKYHSLQREQEELISIGIVGLIKAILSYDNEKSIRLATYASRCIENAILSSPHFCKKRTTARIDCGSSYFYVVLGSGGASLLRPAFRSFFS